jgi:CheY-like chemotaxis protein
MSHNPAAAGLRRQILLVDDDVLLLGLVGTFLRNAGYDVRIATSAPMALDLLTGSEWEPDLAVLDVNMPGMSGLELARHVRANTAIPFMFLSASDDAESVGQAAANGAVGYLVKPVDLAQLAPAIRAGLARGDEIRALRDAEGRLTQALQNGRETGMAVGVLMERFQTDRETAFRALRDHARSQQRKLNDVAAELLMATEAINALAPRINVASGRKPGRPDRAV